MTDLETALGIDPNGLGSYMGAPVVKTGIAIRNAGDGLSQAMKIKPEVLQPGDTVMVLLECEVGAHTHTIDPETGQYSLQQSLKAGTAVIVNDNASASKLRKAADKIARVKEEAKGQDRLEGTSADELEPDDDDPALAAFNGDGNGDEST